MPPERTAQMLIALIVIAFVLILVTQPIIAALTFALGVVLGPGFPHRWRAVFKRSP